MSKMHATNTLNSLEALAVLLPSGTMIDPDSAEPVKALPVYNGPTQFENTAPLDDESLLGLASRLQQALQQWRAQIAYGASLDAQACELQLRRERLAGQLERTRARWRQQKGRHALQGLLDSLGTDLPCFDSETARLLETARGALESSERLLEASLSCDLDALHALTAQLEAIEADPATQLYRTEQARQAETVKWQHLLDQAQAGFRQAQQIYQLEAVQALAMEIALQTPPHSPLHTQAEQLLAMITADVEQMRTAERETAERAARAGFGKWLRNVNRRRGADDLVLTFGIGQGVHVALSGQQNGKGHRRVMLVSAAGFELVEPVVRTLVPQPSRVGYYQLQPATGLPAGGHGRQFEWQRPARQPRSSGNGRCADTRCEES